MVAAHVGSSRVHAISSVHIMSCGINATRRAGRSRQHARRTAQHNNAGNRASHSTHAGEGARKHGGACRCWFQSALSTKVAPKPGAVLGRKDVKETRETGQTVLPQGRLSHHEKQMCGIRQHNVRKLGVAVMRKREASSRATPMLLVGELSEHAPRAVQRWGAAHLKQKPRNAVRAWWSMPSVCGALSGCTARETNAGHDT
ncbi:hypothetical protein, conserved in T. vivax [Trypanosoma vivax Y486]|uniref:Uncharacterized protein n=1 Tax=Trypanosoma vivax (strain Y486) TaxID=1055687 RepID=F9WVN6_TRYVY|nr:hypothetical protein, conserved in T. vivax [Trypanosoma vivax Y486]|eukprot:CCD21644.1 hypothetical protein, conserved in T. vivax [Trypanosoma vivax Y486]